jgi:hypothetical protein
VNCMLLFLFVSACLLSELYGEIISVVGGDVMTGFRLGL